MRAALALALLAAPVSGVAGQQAQLQSFGSGGSVAEAVRTFRAVCMAHPGDAAVQRAAALALKPRAFRPAAGSPPGIESFTLYFTQLSLLDTPQGQVCAVLSPLFDPPPAPAINAEAIRRLGLGEGAIEGGQRVWHQGRGAAPTITYLYHDQTDAMGKPRPTVQLTLTIAKKVR